MKLLDLLKSVLNEAATPKAGDIIIDFTGQEGEVRSTTRNGYMRVQFSKRGITLDLMSVNDVVPDGYRVALGVSSKGTWKNVKKTVWREKV